jgi:hypothetical protein
MLSSARFQDFDGDIQRIHELLIYNQSHFADDEDCDKQLFNATAKFHMILHSLKLSYFIHPCRVWCFMGEDFMRTVQKIGESCVRGLQPTVVSSKMMSHYRLGLHLELSSA